MLNLNQLFGGKGEAYAAKYLKKNGYKIIEKNFRNKIGEIDIIAMDRGVIVFIEVKARKSRAFGSPKDALTVCKQKKISKVALSWLKARNKIGARARFDVVSIISNKSKQEVEIIKNAFELKYQ